MRTLCILVINVIINLHKREILKHTSSLFTKSSNKLQLKEISDDTNFSCYKVYFQSVLSSIYTKINGQKICILLDTLVLMIDEDILQSSYYAFVKLVLLFIVN